MAETAKVSNLGNAVPLARQPALITPSASPPARSWSQVKSRPPTKRPRVDSRNSSPQRSHRASSSSSRQEEIDPNRDEAWRASSKRLLDVWESLAERYNVPLDQDDIIDLSTDELVKDRGILRGLKKSYAFGYLGDPQQDAVEEYASSEDGVHTDADERDEEVDEIDSFAQEPVVPVKIEMEKLKRHVPPFAVGDPDDASDLKEFLEQERKIREKAWEYEAEAEEEVEGTDLNGVIDLVSDEEDGSWSSYEQGHLPTARRSSIVAQRPSQPLRTVTAEQALIAPEGESEDELATAEVDPAPVHATPRPLSRSRSVGGDVDLATPSPSSTLLAKGSLPPAASSSSSSRARTHSVRPSKPRAIRSPVSSRNLQLRTPPSSHAASSVGAGTPDIRSSPISTPPTAFLQQPQTARAHSSPIPSSSTATSSTHHKRGASIPKHVVEVLIPPRPTRRTAQSSMNRELSSASDSMPQKYSAVASGSKQGLKQDKSRVRDVPQLLTLDDISDTEPMPPPKMKSAFSTPTGLRPRFSRAQSLVSAGWTETGYNERRRKRKRSSTSSSALPTSTETSPKSHVAVTAKRNAPRSPSAATSSSAPAKGKGKERGRSKAIASSDESDDPTQTIRGRSLSRFPSSSRASVPPPPSLYQPPILPPLDPGRTAHSLPYPPPGPTPDPQAQYGLAQALHYVSYLFWSGAASRPPPPIPPPVPYRSSSVHTYETPRRRPRTGNYENTSSPIRSSPDSTSIYSTPAGRYSYDPAYSSATSPPISSSPAPSSPTTASYTARVAKVKRSKSRGRRVSFKFDSDDDQHSHFRRRAEERDVTERQAQKRYVELDDLPDSSSSSGQLTTSRQTRGDRGQTPGPSSRHARSKSVR
ncbi:hypothetical protein BDW22DRAFT_1353403 [Trametopsis cervina]|nr:hypothetical protein BDW22DRAFT_1353403 [Trametopsis cervina]